MRTNTTTTILALTLAGAACGHREAEKAPARPVRLEVVSKETGATPLRYSATIQPYEQVGLAFKVGGYVRELRQVSTADGGTRHVQQGDVVAKGTVLARIDPADYQEKVNQARAQLAEADASLAKAKADAARAEALYQAKAMTRPDYDSAVASLAASRARSEAARAALDAASLSLGDASLVAPRDGVILSRSIEPGVLAGVGTLAFALADLSRVKAVFGVPDSLVLRVPLGTRLDITSDTFGGRRFPGRVTAVSPSADSESRVFNIEVTIPNADRDLKAGMVAAVEVGAPEGPELPAGAPTLSVAAVVKGSKAGGFAVFVATGTGDTASVKLRDVRLGRVSGNRVAIEGGVAAGERVVVSGASLLRDGEAVRVIPGSEEK